MTHDAVRVRVAPSPTGDPHVGTAYQALFNHVFARGRGGRFVLRIEDTDRTRSTAASEAAILEALRWLGIGWDEGPDVGGPHAPYRQSERTTIYREHTERLIASGHAYPCFCTHERLLALRAEGHSGYDRRCRDLDRAETARRQATGEPAVIRLAVPREGTCVMHDLLRGEIHKDWEAVDDQVLLKSDGHPTYHLANVVDDHLMEISHVIRGEEWINSLPKHLFLYTVFGWEPPVFCHLPLLRNNDAKRTKLSKRKNPTSILFYRDAGYLPEALVNFLGMMGWTMPGGEEKFTLDAMAGAFRLEDVSLGGPVFDVEKLRWLNGRYIREDHTPERLYRRLEAWALNPERLLRLIPLVQPRLETLGDWARLTGPFFADRVTVDPEALALKGRKPGELAEILQIALWRLDALGRFTAEGIEELFRQLADRLDLKLRDLTAPFYVALSGGKIWTPLYDSMEILGRDLTRARLRDAVEALGGISGKRMKQLEKTYAGLFPPEE